MKGRIHRIVGWAKDLLRRRQTESLKYVRYPSKSSVVIGPVAEIEGVKPTYEAAFVPPRAFSQLNPFGDHHTALSIELGTYQTARAALAKFEGLTDVSLPIVRVNTKWITFPSIDRKVLIRIEQMADRKLGGREMRVFNLSVTDKENAKNVFAKGEFVVAVIRKGETRNMPLK